MRNRLTKFQRSSIWVLLLCSIGFLGILASGCTNNSNPSGGAVDVDLTMLSSTVLFAEVNNMEENPENYFGKTIKMSGAYGTAYLEETDLTYHFVVVDDVTGCCQAAMEFIWQGDHAYPEDYPEETTQIEVIGVFKSYEELGYTWYYLDVNGITIL